MICATENCPLQRRRYMSFINIFLGARTYYSGFLWLDSTVAGCSGVTHKLLFRKKYSHLRNESNTCKICSKLKLENH